tara:strand:- start:827 stop:1084 length:258 start_codon:yes stop_codon:yes gene_type:complete
MIKQKAPFGDASVKDFQIGDMVEWTKWDSIEKKWISNYGILIKIENKIKSNRLVSVSTVKPINEPHDVVELFTVSLKVMNNLLSL